jgi:hypothetical protein
VAAQALIGQPLAVIAGLRVLIFLS